ncbi:hypothetical protein Aduo_000233 [Ancylostoma duodenale]
MWLRALLISLAAWLFSQDMASFPIPADFGCSNLMISDEWRTYVLKLQNKLRRDLAEGKVKTMGSKTAPMGKNINELLWDCDIEKHASDNMCGSALGSAYYGIMETFKNKNGCNVTEEAGTLLKKWWSQSTSIDLNKDVKYTEDAEKNAPYFSNLSISKLK